MSIVYEKLSEKDRLVFDTVEAEAAFQEKAKHPDGFCVTKFALGQGHQGEAPLLISIDMTTLRLTLISNDVIEVGFKGGMLTVTLANACVAPEGPRESLRATPKISAEVKKITRSSERETEASVKGEIGAEADLTLRKPPSLHARLGLRGKRAEKDIEHIRASRDETSLSFDVAQVSDNRLQIELRHPDLAKLGERLFGRIVLNETLCWVTPERDKTRMFIASEASFRQSDLKIMEATGPYGRLGSRKQQILQAVLIKRLVKRAIKTPVSSLDLPTQ